MAKSPPKREIELVPDAWPRFERFIKQIAKAGPQHKPSEMKVGKKKATPKKTTKARTQRAIKKDNSS
jgi:hypothetical protein